jgi:dihydrolipoamide dehydrogenase
MSSNWKESQMSDVVEVKVPDIGDFKDVPVIEVLVKVGDTVKAEDSLITLESDKATMDVPSPVSGVVTELKIKVGDKVAEGTLVALGESRRWRYGGCARSGGTSTGCRPCSSGRTGCGSDCRQRDWQIRRQGRPRMRNAGARRRPRRLFRRLPCGRPRHEDGHRRTLRDAGRRLPQRRLHSVEGAAACRRGDGRGRACKRSRRQFRRAQGRYRQAARAQGKSGRQADRRPGRHGQGAQGRNRARLRPFPRRQPSRSRRDHGTSQDKTGAKKVVRFQKCIIAAGSAALHLPFIPKDPRIVDSTGALELRFVPKRMLVIGGGIIGLEMATVYSTLGAKVDVVEMLDGLMQGPDRDLVKVWEKQNAKRFDKVMLKTKTVAVDAKPKTASGSSSKASRRRPNRSATT